MTVLQEVSQVRKMFRGCLLVALCHLSIAYGQGVNFPEEETHRQNEPDLRYGMKYLVWLESGERALVMGANLAGRPPVTGKEHNLLEDSSSIRNCNRFYNGYFLSLLSTTFAGYQPSAIQTPAGTTTVRPITPLPVFSPASSMSSAASEKTSSAVTTTTAASVSSVTTGLSTFPTAIPTSFPTGLITSFGTFPPIATPSPVEPLAPLVNTDGYVCGCLPISVCVNQTTRSGASVRIVTSPPQGTTCPTGMVYCCAPNRSHLCGLQNIIPGVTPGPGQANLGEFPWSAVILTDAGNYVGGGALIDELHVLTAAHKVAGHGNGSMLKIRFGDWDLSSTREPVRDVEVKVKSITNHPMYDSVNLKNDISIITLASPVATLSVPRPQINTICLPKARDSFVGEKCWVAGWGKDQFNGSYQQIIKKVDLPVVAPADCQRRLRETRLGSSFVLDTASFLCAGGEANKDACTGDGGNALACMKNGQYFIAGITVGGIECGLANVPGLYVNMVNYLSWIESVIRPPAQGIDPRRKPLSQD